MLGRSVSIALVNGPSWWIGDRRDSLQFPVHPTRVNLQRLMAHALYTLDLRTPGVLGREALEAMLCSSPIVVPEQSAAQAHVEAASGGLWYRNAGELLDAARILLDEPLRARLAAQAGEYANERHGRLDAFVERTARLVLGEGS